MVLGTKGIAMTKKRDKEYGPKPQDTPLKREDLPPSPAKKPAGYCKKRKAEHLFELDEVITYKKIGPLDRRPGYPLFIKGFTDYKIYRCTTCRKKKYERVETIFDIPRPYIKEKTS